MCYTLYTFEIKKRKRASGVNGGIIEIGGVVDYGRLKS